MRVGEVSVKTFTRRDEGVTKLGTKVRMSPMCMQ